MSDFDLIQQDHAVLLNANYLYENEIVTPICKVEYNEHSANGYFFDMTARPFRRAATMFQDYAYCYGTLTRYADREIFTVKETGASVMKEDFSTLDKAIEYFRERFAVTVANKSYNNVLTLRIHYTYNKCSFFGWVRENPTVMSIRVDFNKLNAPTGVFCFECYCYPTFSGDSTYSSYSAMGEEERKMCALAREIFINLRNIQGYRLNTERWGTFYKANKY